MSGEYGSYQSGFLHDQIRYAADDFQESRSPFAKHVAKLMRGLVPYAQGVCWHEECDSGPDYPAKEAMALPALLREVADDMEADETFCLIRNLMEGEEAGGIGMSEKIPTCLGVVYTAALSGCGSSQARLALGVVLEEVIRADRERVIGACERAFRQTAWKDWEKTEAALKEELLR